MFTFLKNLWVNNFAENSLLHADIVVTHACNFNCKFCIDKFVNTDTTEIKLSDIKSFLELLTLHVPENSKFTILLLGGEPTMLSTRKLIDIADLIHSYGFRASMSTNGVDREKIKSLLPHYEWIQITIRNKDQADYWRGYDNINLKLAGDQSLTFSKLVWFMNDTTDFKRRSISMYQDQKCNELCKDKDVWDLLNTFDWKKEGSYKYAFYRGIRFKRNIPGWTNIVDEPRIPKLYPNGNYNKTWLHEKMDDYLKKEKIVLQG